ncbi:DUF1761 domain-containing protein [Macrococcoides canis]|uniref:DUF1761 domain-containing protein n=1 Tax=Macrococcoides canis TaxID=1855823 RepID=UPI0020B7A887|nr:DUF1761 domain-containing protein [Macrococcus canis]UTH00450.1 DUF1761 domain-containing protein [Macrococcus canis]
MNFIAAIIAGLIAFIIGGLWYSVLFGKAWQREVKITDAEIKEAGSGTPQMILAVIVEVIVSLCVFFLLTHTDLNVLCAGAVIGLISVLSSLKNYFFEMKSIKLILINESYRMICFMIMAIAAYFFN